MEAILPWFVIGSTDQAEYFLGVEVRVIEGLLDIIWLGFWILDFRFLNWIFSWLQLAFVNSSKIDLTTQVLLCKKLLSMDLKLVCESIKVIFCRQCKAFHFYVMSKIMKYNWHCYKTLFFHEMQHFFFTFSGLE